MEKEKDEEEVKLIVMFSNTVFLNPLVNRIVRVLLDNEYKCSEDIYLTATRFILYVYKGLFLKCNLTSLSTRS